MVLKLNNTNVISILPYSLSFYSIKKIIFLLISFIYGFFSTSTPDKIGIPEILIMFLLVIFFLPNLFELFFDIINPATNFRKILLILIIGYFVFFLTFWGVIFRQNELNNFIRDFIPLLYFFIPIFMLYDIKKNPFEWLKIILISLIIIGVGFSYQFYTDPSVNFNAILSLTQLYGENRDNPWQDPASVFTFSFFASLSVYYLFSKKLLKFIVSFLFYILFLFVYAVTVSRAPIALSILTIILVLWFVIPYKSKNKWIKREIVVIFGMFVFILIFHYFNSIIINIYNLIMLKTQTAGIDNSRLIEIKAVIDNINNIPILLFGEGLGGLIANPIGGGAKWRFVHNMFFYFIFKSGIIGLSLVLLYFYWILKVFFKWKVIFLKFKPVMIIGFVSLISPLIVAGILEPMFKTLSFGMLLSLILSYKLSILRMNNARLETI